MNLGEEKKKKREENNLPGLQTGCKTTIKSILSYTSPELQFCIRFLYQCCTALRVLGLKTSDGFSLYIQMQKVLKGLDQKQLQVRACNRGHYLVFLSKPCQYSYRDVHKLSSKTEMRVTGKRR